MNDIPVQQISFSSLHVIAPEVLDLVRLDELFLLYFVQNDAMTFEHKWRSSWSGESLRLI